MIDLDLPAFPQAFASFPDTARAWLFAAPSPVALETKLSIRSRLAETLAKWKSHGTEIRAQATFLDEVTFLVVADFTQAEMSGCSIDRMISAVRDAGAATGTDLLDARGVHFWNGTGFHFAGRERFADLVASGQVGAETIVLDLTRTTLGEVRAGKWKVPAGAAWHRRAFALAGASAAA